MLLAFAPPTANQLSYTIPASRSSAQIDNETGILYFTTQMFALVAAADLHTGAVLGFTQINPHELAISTASPTLYKGVLFVGGSSVEEDVDRDISADYSCCSFIGNAAAFKFDRTTGTFVNVWNVPMLPRGSSGTGNGSWSGIGIWGSQPAIDVTRNQVRLLPRHVTSPHLTSPHLHTNSTSRSSSAPVIYTAFQRTSSPVRSSIRTAPPPVRPLRLQ